jgi:hypothetical protein
MSYDDLIQAGPRSDSEVVASRITVTLVLRELVRPVVAAPKPEMHKLATVNPKRDRDVYLCKLSRQTRVTEKPRALAQARHRRVRSRRHPCDASGVAAIGRPRSARIYAAAVTVLIAPLFRPTADILPRPPEFPIARQVSTVNSPGRESHVE